MARSGYDRRTTGGLRARPAVPDNGTMVNIGTVVLHVADVHRAAQFWSGALGYVVRHGEIGEETPVLVAPDGSGPALALDLTDRTHLDLHAADADEQHAEVERLLALGARRVDWTYPEGANFVVLADTEGNLFCVIDGSRT